jgi:hypothetical protein
MLRRHYHPHNGNPFNPLRHLRSLCVDQSVILGRDWALKRDVLTHTVLIGVRVHIYFHAFHENQRIVIDSGVLGSWAWPRLQGLRGRGTSTTSSFNVCGNNCDLCNPPDCHAHWSCTSTTIALVWTLEDALSTSMIFARSHFRGIDWRIWSHRDGCGLHWRS